DVPVPTTLGDVFLWTIYALIMHILGLFGGYMIQKSINANKMDEEDEDEDEEEEEDEEWGGEDDEEVHEIGDDEEDVFDPKKYRRKDRPEELEEVGDEFELELDDE
ncbi:MAG: hypothetical protein ACMUHU_06170, partial [Thermoplasmatota archaeon]